MFGRLFWLSVGSVVYTYAGYPALLAAFARLRRRPAGSAPITPPVTLLITAYNEEDVIAQKLENSLALDYPRDRLQIIVAADGSSDRTVEIVQGFAGRGVELSFSPPRRGKMAAINRAIPYARGEVLVFSDANNLYAPDTLRALVQHFADPAVGAVSGAKVILQGDGALGDSEGLYGRYEAFIKRQETRLSSCIGAVGECMALRRELFEAPPDTIINDDFYLAMRIIQRGYRVVFEPRARSYERISLSARDEVARRARIVAGRYQALMFAPRLLPLRQPLVVWQAASHKFLRPLVPFALILALLANIGAVIWPGRGGHGALWRLAPPYGRLMLALQGVFYLLAWLGGRLERTSAAAKLLYLPTFLVNSNAAAVIGLYRFLTRRQTTTWQRVARRATGALRHAPTSER